MNAIAFFRCLGFRKLLPVLFIQLCLSFGALAQDFRWLNRGGSTGSANSAQVETVDGMATDANGNVYVLGRVWPGTINISGKIKNGYGDQDVVLCSYNCNGDLRWAKIMGSKIYDEGFAVQTDKVGGVYVAVLLSRFQGTSTNPIYIDSDTTINNSNDNRGMYLIKFDTSGKYKWARTPLSDTVHTPQSQSDASTLDLEVDQDGTIHWLCQLYPAAYAQGAFVVNTMWDYILKYDKNGNFLSGLRADPFFTNFSIRYVSFSHESQSGNYYFSGFHYGATSAPNTIFILNHDSVTNSKYVIAVDATGKYLWKKENNILIQGFYGKPVIDKDGNIYVGGMGNSASTAIPPFPADNFNGYICTHGDGRVTPLILKLDRDGNMLWGADATVNASTGGWGVALRNSGEIDLVGAYPGKLKWPGYDKDSFNLPPNNGSRPFITRFNTQTGKVLGMAQIANVFGDSWPNTTTIMADGRNNVFIGGRFGYKLIINSDSIEAIGGETDFYTAKFGYDNCGCTNIPEPKFSFNKSTPTQVSFTYTGSSGYSSIKWDFDDGNTSIQANPSHTYTAIYPYTVCVTVTNSCGDNTYCANIPMWPAGVNNIDATEAITIYPNPVSENCILEGAVIGSAVAIVDITGRVVANEIVRTNRQPISTKSLMPGMYLVRVTNLLGQTVIKKIVKE